MQKTFWVNAFQSRLSNFFRFLVPCNMTFTTKEHILQNSTFTNENEKTNKLQQRRHRPDSISHMIHMHVREDLSDIVALCCGVVWCVSVWHSSFQPMNLCIGHTHTQWKHLALSNKIHKLIHCNCNETMENRWTVLVNWIYCLFETMKQSTQICHRDRDNFHFHKPTKTTVNEI